jgi:N-acetylmuramoyl-L-alanine amidase
MVQLQYHKQLIFIIFTLSIFFNFSCQNEHKIYEGSIKLDKHTWLKGKKIFIDPGHGGKGKKDRFRVGPNNVLEEEVNLRVSLILENMLIRAGATVGMSRRSNIDISLNKRVDMIADFQPKLLVSIHHNGSPRKSDGVNYPTVFIWGSNLVRPASYDMALLLQKELNGIMDNKGVVLSDYSVYSETGTRILRETRYICPGVLGEGGFFTDPDHSLRLKDIHYNQLEAEAYFRAISHYFMNGIPSASVLISSKVDNTRNMVNLIEEKKPAIAIKIQSNNPVKGIALSSLRVTLDNIPVRYKKLSSELYLINYGKKLYPGGHSLRFSFRNKKHQSSMIMSVPITVNIKKGDFKRLIKRGRYLLRSRYRRSEGLKMLLSAYSMDKTGPETDSLLLDISRGFRYLGDLANSRYYLKKLHYFYPQSKYAKKSGYWIYRNSSYRFPVDYYGKKVELIGGVDIKGYNKHTESMTIEEWFRLIQKKIIDKKEIKLQR